MPPPGATRGLDVLAQGAREHLLGGEGFLGSSFLVARALDTAGLVQGPRALGPGHLLREEVAEAPLELHRPCRTGGEAARETAQESPYGTNELGDVSEPLLVEVVDGAVAQELACHAQRGLRIRGSATGMR